MTADLTVLLGLRRAPRDSVYRSTAPSRSMPDPAGHGFDVVAYCDGSLKQGARDGAGVWSGVGGWGVVAWSAAAPRSPVAWMGACGRVASSSAAEPAAVGHALRLAPPGRLLVRSDSQVALGWLRPGRAPGGAYDPLVMRDVLLALRGARGARGPAVGARARPGLRQQGGGLAGGPRDPLRRLRGAGGGVRGRAPEPRAGRLGGWLTSRHHSAAEPA